MKGLAPGLYRIWWRDGGGESLAAVGQLHDGSNWLAPCNWTAQFADGVATSSHWHMVSAYERVDVSSEEETP